MPATGFGGWSRTWRATFTRSAPTPASLNGDRLRRGQRTVKFNFAPYGTQFHGGVRVATGDVTGDGRADLIVAAGPGGGPLVKVYDGVTGNLVRSFYAYATGFTGGVNLAVGDVTGDGRLDIITGADAGGGPHVQVFDGKSFNVVRSFLAYNAGFSGGVRVAVGDVNLDGRSDIITGAGIGGRPHVKVFDGASGGVLRRFFEFSAGFAGSLSRPAISTVMESRMSS